MKNKVLIILTFLILGTIISQTALAQVVFDHGSSVNSVGFSPDGTILVAVSRKEFKSWDVNTHTNIATFTLERPREVASVAISPDGTTLASGGGFFDEAVKLWDVKTYTNIATLEGHRWDVTAVAFSPDGETLASGSGFPDKTVKLWDVNTHTHIATLEGHRDDVTCMAFSPDGILLAYGSEHTVRLWDATTHTNIATFTLERPHEVTAVAFSPDGTTLASGGKGWRPGVVKLWDVETLQISAALTVDRADIHSVTFSPDGTLLASGGKRSFGIGAVKLWDVKTHENIAAFETVAHFEYVASVSFSPDGTLLASGSSDGKVKLWNIAEWTSTLEIISGENQEGIIDTALPNPLVVEVRDRDNNPIPGVQISFTVTKGEGVLNGEAEAVEVTTDAYGRAAHTLTLGPTPGTNSVKVSIANELVTFEAEGVSPYQLVKISGDDQQATLGTALADPLVVEVRDREDNPLPDHQVKFNVTHGEGLLNGQYTVKHVTTDANGRAAQTLTLSQSITNTVNVSIGYESVWFHAAGNSSPHIATLSVVNRGNFLSVSLSPDGTLIASGDGATVKLWNVASHTNIATLEGHTDEVILVAFSDDGALLASSSEDDTVKLWDVAQHTNITTFEGHTGVVTSLAFTDDGALLASGAWDGVVKVWDITTHENIATLGGHRDEVLNDWFRGWHVPVAFSPDGTTLAYGALEEIKFWDVATKQEVATIVAHPKGVISLSFSSDGTMLASNSEDVINLWNVETREYIPTSIPGGDYGIFQIAFIPNSTILAYTTNVVVLWDVTIDMPIAILEGHTGEIIWSLSFSSDGTTLASSSERKVKLWDIAEAKRSTRVLPTVSISPSSMQSPAIGERFTLSLNIAYGKNVAGYQAVMSFDNTVLRYVESENGDYLLDGVLFEPPIIDRNGGRVTLAATSPSGASNGNGTLATLTFEVVAIKDSTLRLSDVSLSNSAGESLHPHLKNGEVVEPDEELAVESLAKRIATLGDIKRTALLQNFPNPFNPETWIPYQLAEDALVTLTVCKVNGHMVHKIEVGHQKSGSYESQNKAIYWDGKNQFGEHVASGVYFYHLSAGNYSATRKMLILK